jgi:glucose-1-phosphate adenylyltransferase
MLSHVARSAQDTFCVLLAGGKGSRLHELTRAKCKPALPFAGGRLVDFTLANAERSGVSRMLVATQYTPRTLWQHLDRNWRHSFSGGLDVQNGESLCAGGYRGTADAVRRNCDRITESGAPDILVLSADHVYEMDYNAMIAQHRQSGAMVTLAVDEVPIDRASAFGVLATDRDGLITEFAEKPQRPQPAPHSPVRAQVSMGVYVLDRRWLSGLLTARPDMTDFGHDVLPAAVRLGLARVYRPAAGPGRRFYWRDVGTLDSYRCAQLDCLDPARAPIRVPGGPTAPSLQALAAAAHGTVLMPGARLGRFARVERAIIAPHAHVPDGMVIGVDPDADRRWFRVTPEGTVLVTAEMLARRMDETPACLRPVLAWPPLTARGI